jgi:hypothetical protein
MRLPPNAHDDLFSPAALQLAVIHWHLLKSDALMSSLTIEEESVEGSRFKRHVRTTFGKEVGADEIKWWVVKRERNLEELLARSRAALAAVEVLKSRSRELQDLPPHRDSYGQIVATLRRFVDSNADHITTVRDYVGWLHSKDPLAPSMLFTYRVWGSTKRSDRMIDLQADTAESESAATMRQLTETVVGLRSQMGLAYERLWMDRAYDLAEAAAESGASWEVPEDELLQMTAWRAFRECADYFGETRDSLRNIILDIEEFQRQRNVLHDDRFWRRFVERAVGSPTETGLWDFKETLPMWHASGGAKAQAKLTLQRMLQASQTLAGAC